jgi:hypothetical protein
MKRSRKNTMERRGRKRETALEQLSPLRLLAQDAIHSTSTHSESRSSWGKPIFFLACEPEKRRCEIVKASGGILEGKEPGRGSPNSLFPYF